MQKQSKNWPGVQYPLNVGMIVIHTGIIIYPAKDSAERGLIFSKYRFLICIFSMMNVCLYPLQHLQLHLGKFKFQKILL